MHSSPLISIILPFSKEGLWLEEAVSSILQQTFRHYELLLIGNHSDADTLQLAEKLSATDARIRLSSSTADHLGQVLNAAIATSTGRYITRMDADDFSLPTRLEKQFDHLQANPQLGVSAVATGPHPQGRPGDGFASFMEWQNCILDPEAHYRNRFIEATVAHPAVMMRRSLFDLYGNYPESGPEDFGLWLRWLSAGVQFAKIPEPLLLWRDHAQRLSRTGAHYSSESFTRVKASFAVPLIETQRKGRNIILCGAGRTAREKMKIWESAGLRFDGYSDVKQRQLDRTCWPLENIRPNSEGYYVSLLNGRGKAEEMRAFFNERGLKEEADYLLSS